MAQVSSSVPVHEGTEPVNNKVDEHQEFDDFRSESSAAQAADSDPDLSDNDADPTDPRLSEEEAESLIGVSIGKEQSRYRSPRTPAEERYKVLGDSEDFPDVEASADNEDNIHYEVTDTPEQSPKQKSLETAEPSLRFPPEKRFPGPASKSQQTTTLETGRSFLRDALAAPRRRSSSGPMAVAESFKRLFNDMPMPSMSFPKGQNLPSFTFAQRAKDGAQRPHRSSTMFARYSPGISPSPQSAQRRIAPSMDGNLSSTSRDPMSRTAPTTLTASPDERVSPGRNLSGYFEPLQPRLSQNLRSVNSEGSLYMQNQLSRVSTSDDTAKYQDISEQINVRFKAIKDSFQDSAMRNLPKMPSVDLSAFKPSFSMRTESGRSTQSQSAQELGQGTRSGQSTTSHGYQGQQLPSNIGHDASGEKNTYPNLSHALSELTGDVLVLGGYRGSILRSAEPPHRQVWVPLKIGLNLRKVDLEVGLTDEDEERMEEKIIPSGVLSHIGPVDICRRLLRKLRKCHNAKTGKLQVHDYGYDWRLNPNLLVRRFIADVERLKCNQSDVPKHKRGVTVIAHSLGGLIVRCAVNQRPELFAGVVYAGVPQHCVNILGPLRNGDDVLFSSRVLTAQVNFTLRTSFALMPESGFCFIDIKTGEHYDVDFFDAKTWEECRLTPCLRPPLPPYMAQEERKSMMDTVSETLTSFPKRPSVQHDSAAGKVKDAVQRPVQDMDSGALEPTMNSPPPQTSSDAYKNASNSVATKVTISRDDAFEYLTRTLASVLAFKRSLAFKAEHQTSNSYPPAAVLYGKSLPTLYGARVASREAIKHSDAYDNLAFAAGDGVVLTKAAMLPSGYRLVKGGLVRSERGHVGLLGDLDGVGTCLLAIIDGRRKGIGLGREKQEAAT